MPDDSARSIQHQRHPSYSCGGAAIAQLAARRSHNPKVVSSILTRRKKHGAAIEAKMQEIWQMGAALQDTAHGIIGLVVEYSLAMAVTWVRFPDDASASMGSCGPAIHHVAQRSIVWPIDPKLSIVWPNYPPCSQAIIHAVKLSSMRP